jgi:hypothetical protein
MARRRERCYRRLKAFSTGPTAATITIDSQQTPSSVATVDELDAQP